MSYDVRNVVQQQNWTPVLSFGGASVGITYSAQDGTFSRIGNICYFACEVMLTNKGSSVGSARITGIPVNQGGITTTIPVGYNVSNLTFVGVPFFTIAGATIACSKVASGGASADLTDADFSNTTTLILSGCYLAS